MTTPDPALAAALDRLLNCSRLVGKTMALNYSGGRSELLAQEAAARAAVVACAAPVRERMEKLEKVAEMARFSVAFWPDRPVFGGIRAALAALDGEPEDAGAEVQG